MSYEIKWNRKPIKYLEKLPKDIASRILNKLETIKEDPFHYLEHYEGDKVYKLRIGDYRVLIDTDSANKILKIRVLDHRSRIYKR